MTRSESTEWFFFPTEPADASYKTIADNLALNDLHIIARRIVSLIAVHQDVKTEYRVGKAIYLDGSKQVVQAIFEFESDAFCVCTDKRGIVVDQRFRTPIFVGGNEVLSVTYFRTR